ncbi:MAG TPA: glycoside hydrolase family 9 protein [Candidatus Hydrogenedentes bacterium]|nr:glycoside hydrolase family 9 protein [Candidatus Hydrogenedentota bacterium]
MNAIECQTRGGVLAIATCFVVVCCAAAGDPLSKWVFDASSNLYAPPLTVDVHPAPGLEMIISDSEAKRLRCLDAKGNELWAYDGHWTKRLISAAALDTSSGLLVVGNADGRLCCIEARTGAERWQKEIGPVEWGGALWADIDGDGAAEILLGTEDRGVIALEADGTICWHTKGSDPNRPWSVRCPLAAADINNDQKAEIFGCGTWGPFCLNGDGSLRWEQCIGDDFTSAPVLIHVDAEWRLYCSSRNDGLLWAFDATTGNPKWSKPLFGNVDAYSGGAIAAGDINQDGFPEIVAGDLSGHLHVFAEDGTLLWVFSAQQAAHISATLGDVDGDGQIEVLAACGDHHVYCLNALGELKWKFAAELRLIFPPTLADVDQDGKTDILFGGSDHKLRCLTLGGRYRPELFPWPSRRLNPAQNAAKNAAAQVRYVSVMHTLFVDGDFEVDKTAESLAPCPEGSALLAQRKILPKGWLLEPQNDKCGLDDAVAFTGKRSMRLLGPVTLCTKPIVLETGLKEVMVSLHAKSEGAIRGYVEWMDTQGKICTSPSNLSSVSSENGWLKYRQEHLVPPAGVRWMQVACSIEDRQTTWVDGVEIQGVFNEIREARALVNQVGYDVGAPKYFTVQGNWKAASARFVLVRSDQGEAFQGNLNYAGRIQGCYGQDWGYEYWRGDFSAFDEPGNYRIHILLDDFEDLSWPFEIGKDLLWERTARPAYRFFYYQRCGMEIPGFHKACHLDDAIGPDKQQYDLWGGWHDAGDYNTYHNAPYVYGLARAYGIQQKRFDIQDEDHNGVSDFLDEIIWGGEHARRMIAPDGSAYGGITSGYGYWGPPELETDNKPGTGDERPVGDPATGHDPGRHTAALARIAALAPDSKPWIEPADRSLRWSLEHNQRGVPQFSAAIDLYCATHDEKYAVLARELFPGIGAAPDVVDAVKRFDETFHEDHAEALRTAVIAHAEEILPLAENPFGVYTFGPKDRPNFFGTPAGSGGWHVGTSSRLMEAANFASLAHQYAPNPRYLKFIYDQFNWTLGTNPFDISLMEGQGSAFPPTYHQRLTFGGLKRGAVPGSVVNGITWRAQGDDRPFFDMSGVDIPICESNEVWLPHNMNYLNALANLYRGQ